MEPSPYLTSEEWARLRAHWRMLRDFEQSYFRTDGQAFLEWLQRQSRDIFDKVVSVVSTDSYLLDESLFNCLD